MDEILEQTVTAVMDCIEDCFTTMTLPVGKRLVKVFGVTLVFTAVALLMKFLGIPTFLTWQEAAAASLIVGLICGIQGMTKSRNKKLKEKMNQT
jgi:hypothetical protein